MLFPGRSPQQFIPMHRRLQFVPDPPAPSIDPSVLGLSPSLVDLSPLLRSQLDGLHRPPPAALRSLSPRSYTQVSTGIIGSSGPARLYSLFSAHLLRYFSEF